MKGWTMHKHESVRWGILKFWSPLNFYMNCKRFRLSLLPPCTYVILSQETSNFTNAVVPCYYQYKYHQQTSIMLCKSYFTIGYQTTEFQTQLAYRYPNHCCCYNKKYLQQLSNIFMLHCYNVERFNLPQVVSHYCFVFSIFNLVGSTTYLNLTAELWIGSTIVVDLSLNIGLNARL